MSVFAKFLLDGNQSILQLCELGECRGLAQSSFWNQADLGLIFFFPATYYLCTPTLDLCLGFLS